MNLSKPGKLGVWYAADKLQPDEWRSFLKSVESLGYGTLWHSESRHYEAMSFGAFALANTTTLNIGTSIANIYARDAVSSACASATLNEFSGGRYILGLGVSHVPLVEKLRGHEYRKPVTAMRRYLNDMKAAGDDATNWPVTIAALGPRMLELAAECASGALPYNVTPEHTAQAAEIMNDGQMLVVEQKVCLESDPATARALARAELGRYMTLPNYVNNWRRLGFTDDDFANGGSDRFMDAMVVWGNEAAIEERVREHYDAGATHVCIQPVHAAGDLDAAVRTLTALAPA
jgi:probable F420-dependent oxidoreductase